MTAKVLVLLLLFTSLNIYAQSTNPSQTDELTQHLSAAETYQISGDLTNAAIENKAVAGIALERLGNLAIEEGEYQRAVQLLREAADYRDNSSTRTNLAVAYLRQGDFENAVSAGEFAVSLDEKFAYAHYILGNIYFTKGDYEKALPQLEKVFILEPTFDVARALGLTYLHLKQLERAKLLFEEMQVSLKKESADLHILFGQAFEQTNYPLEAEREFKRALEINPKQPRANFYLGYVILQHGGSERLGEAAAAFERELAVTDDFYTNFFAGVTAASQNDNAKAEEYLKKAVGLNPNSGEAFLFLGQAQLEQDKVAEAEKNLRRAVELEKKDAKAASQARRTHFLLGRLLLKNGKTEEAKAELEIARRLQQESLDSSRDEINRILGQVVADSGESNKKNVENQPNTTAGEDLSPERKTEIKKLKNYLTEVLAQAYYNLGVVAFQTRRVAEAIAKFNATLKIKPDFPGVARNLGIINFREKRFAEAIEPLKIQLDGNPGDNLVRQMLGASYHFTGDYGRAAATLKPIASLLNSDPELAFFYGISLVQLEKFDEARPVFDSLANAAQQNPNGLYYAAQGFMYLGDYERAVREFSSVLALSPEKPKANFFKGQSLIRLNRFDEAEAAFREELRLNPIDESSKYHLALTLIERKERTDEAISLLQDAIRLKPGYADAHYQLGKIYIEKGETERAIEQLESAVRSDDQKDYIHYQLSIAYRKASRMEDATRELKIYQKLKSESRKNQSPMPMGGQQNVP
ncbi:MAG: tetratricopeptide repeat protein [Pyrinomonadaceae bacterium]